MNSSLNFVGFRENIKLWIDFAPLELGFIGAFLLQRCRSYGAEEATNEGEGIEN